MWVQSRKRIAANRVIEEPRTQPPEAAQRPGLCIEELRKEQCRAPRNLAFVRVFGTLVAALLFGAACGSDDVDQVTASETDSQATTTVISASALANSPTWDEYRAQVEADTALACVISRDMDPNNQHGMDQSKFEAIYSVFFEQRENPGDEDAVSAFDNYEQLEPIREVRSWVYKQTHEHEILERVHPEPETIVPLTHLYRDLSQEVFAGDDDDLIDLGPILRESLTLGLTFYQYDLSCPLVGGVTAIRSALENFSSDNATLGGRGKPAHVRCLGSAVVDLALTKLVADPSDSTAAELVDLGYSVFDANWGNDGWDVAAEDFMSAFTVMQNRAGGELTADDSEQIAQLQADWLAYRDSRPEGFILCPLDRGWEPS